MVLSLFSTVSKTSLPVESGLNARRAKGDFLDCFSVSSDLAARQAAEIITAFPVWVQVLLRLRNVITYPFGLKGEGPDTTDRVGIFPVESDTARELIAGFDDKHLNFRVSVYSQEGRVSLATWVSPHNFGGRLYLWAIMPFHILIARNALVRVQASTSA